MSKDFCDIVFRILFSSIFIGLGGEHLFNDELIQKLMPEWVGAPRLFSLLAGIVLVSGGTLIVLGYQLRFAAILLAAFLIAVTACVHAPGVSQTPEFIHREDIWLWDILQRSNFVKNLCLLGVCLMLYHYQSGRFTLQRWLSERKSP